jgi:hypothetical protein
VSQFKIKLYLVWHNFSKIKISENWSSHDSEKKCSCAQSQHLPHSVVYSGMKRQEYAGVKRKNSGKFLAFSKLRQVKYL